MGTPVSFCSEAELGNVNEVNVNEVNWLAWERSVAHRQADKKTRIGGGEALENLGKPEDAGGKAKYQAHLQRPVGCVRILPCELRRDSSEELLERHPRRGDNRLPSGGPIPLSVMMAPWC